jgi:hypothetical protein
VQAVLCNLTTENEEGLVSSVPLPLYGTIFLFKRSVGYCRSILLRVMVSVLPCYYPFRFAMLSTSHLSIYVPLLHPLSLAFKCLF